ncbi:MAG TPA: glycosyltransferase family 1 protein [Vicinamibacterales bacterium]|nr:glycosyltransferase family 1 protein [Vicinamibacterales bacterium]
MRVGVNGRRLEGQRLGVGRYIEYLLRHWEAELGERDRITVFVRAPFDPNTAGLSGRVQVRLLEPRLTGLSWENVVLPWQASDIDVLFCPSYTAPLAYRGPMVVATHSVNESDPNSSTWKDRYLYGTSYRLSARRADDVVVPAEVTRRHVQEFYGINPDRVHVVPQGADDSFQPVTDERLLADTRRRYLGADVPFVLFVGKLSERRNIPTLIRAFAGLSRSGRIPHRLLLVGPNHHHLRLPELIAELGVEASVVQTDGRFASHGELVPIYSAADLFVHPSMYEGFSITTVEALSCGVPVVAANRGGLGEIATGAALLVDDPTEDALARAMLAVLTDPARARAMRLASGRRGQAFRWQNTASETWRIIEGAVQRRARLPVRGSVHPAQR